MLKMIVINWRKPGITLEDFNQHWLVKHGPLVKEHAKARGFVRYVQSQNLPNAEFEAFAEQRGKQVAPNGVTEVWWEDLESMQAAMSSREGRKASAALDADEVNFVSSRQLSAFLCEEKIIFDFTEQSPAQASRCSSIKTRI